MGRAFEYRRAAKEARWDKMSKIFPKLAKAIQVAAKEGGADPGMNARLRSAIAAAKAQNMPKDKIDAAIKRATGKDAAAIHSIHYEARAPHGALLIIECATDNPTRTVANIKAILNKHGAELLSNGSLDFMFARKAVFRLEPVGAGELDELEFALIDAGLESLAQDEEELVITGAYADFGRLGEGIERYEAAKLTVKRAGLEWLANAPVELGEEELAGLEKILDKLEEDDDVQEIYVNVG